MSDSVGNLQQPILDCEIGPKSGLRTRAFASLPDCYVEQIGCNRLASRMCTCGSVGGLQAVWAGRMLTVTSRNAQLSCPCSQQANASAPHMHWPWCDSYAHHTLASPKQLTWFDHVAGQCQTRTSPARNAGRGGLVSSAFMRAGLDAKAPLAHTGWEARCGIGQQ